MAKLYRILTGTDDAAFCHKITKALNDGWDLHGSPTVSFNTKDNRTICAQAVTKDVVAPYNPDISLSEQ
ncbi:MAG: DUF1737 domain-containing protein [Rhizobiaceae bacterium]|nr:DUF1737 domain-containing protein [Rhizobiaceae bacterium]MBL4696801.1 DUF1737 domain-containing protein [Rhizobiaceae bacterium]